MSMDNLTYAEQYYFEKMPDYRRAIMDWLKSRGLTLRLAFVEIDNASHISTHTGLMNKIKGASKGRGKRTTKWRYVKKRR